MGLLIFFGAIILMSLLTLIGGVFSRTTSTRKTSTKKLSVAEEVNEAYKLLSKELGCLEFQIEECYHFILRRELNSDFELELLLKKFVTLVDQEFIELNNEYKYTLNRLILDFTIDFKTINKDKFLSNKTKDIATFIHDFNMLGQIKLYDSFVGKYINITDLIPENIRQFESSLVDINLSDEDYFELFYSNRNVLFESKAYIENKEFQIAVDLFNNNQSFFLTGAAGTGKSSFIDFITSYTKKRYAIIAPTGIAALNVKGQTIHSFFKFDNNLDQIRYKSNDVPKFDENNRRRKLIENIDVLIIDEISMVRVDVMDAIDYSLRINGGNPNLPFGGKQIIIIGDVFQLGPVANNQVRNELLKFWTNIYFFNSKSYNEKLFQIINLKINYRNADDQEFIKLLDKIKVGEITQNELTQLSQGRIINHINQLENKIILTTTNPNAKQFNDLCLRRLNTDSYFYEAEIIDNFPMHSYPTERTLELKIGAQIMFIKNDTLDLNWVNGSIGEIFELNESEISVKLKNKSIVIVKQHGFENFEFRYNAELRKTVKTLVGKFTQFPIKLAWAITIHKSQGLTFDEIVIDVSSGTFGTGQLYVALSRARKLIGIYFTTPLLLNNIKVDKELIEFYNNYILNNH